MEILNNSNNSQYISESFFFINLPFYNLPQLIFENNIDEVAVVMGETKASYFWAFSITLTSFSSNIAAISARMLFLSTYMVFWLVGINFTL